MAEQQGNRASEGRSNNSNEPPVREDCPIPYASMEGLISQIGKLAADEVKVAPTSPSQTGQAEGLMANDPQDLGIDWALVPHWREIINMLRRAGAGTPNRPLVPVRAPPFGVIGDGRPRRALAQVPQGQQAQVPQGQQAQVPHGQLVQVPYGQQQLPGGSNLQTPNPAGLSELLHNSTPLTNGGPAPNPNRQWAESADHHALHSTPFLCSDDPGPSRYDQQRQWEEEQSMHTVQRYSIRTTVHQLPLTPAGDGYPAFRPLPVANGQSRTRNDGSSTSDAPAAGQPGDDEDEALRDFTNVFDPSEDEQL
ncbi:hypothetical protein CONLIGDRAFT_643716 [Coniochaeta ligniaria NRRL 30616]|uniref:Uncharacterized protein n=1 Tax=Coniochaeta ligniaria NRRL 30616 TaxID=1408157 RepID=A0A1J7IPU0_9PEZI|nr:hypothetical protein CONLIGDRAFT_643716 [Coniochaeta ligniaria NRRL 30616]